MLSDYDLQTIILSSPNQLIDMINKETQINKRQQGETKQLTDEENNEQKENEENDQQSTITTEQLSIIENLKKENQELKRRMNEFNDVGTKIIYQLNDEILNLQERLSQYLNEEQQPSNTWKIGDEQMQLIDEKLKLIQTLEQQKLELLEELDSQNLFISQCHDKLINQFQDKLELGEQQTLKSQSSLNFSEKNLNNQLSQRELMSQQKQTINLILNTLERINQKVDFTQCNENELIYFQKLIEQQLKGQYKSDQTNSNQQQQQDQEQFYESTQVITPRSLNQVASQTQTQTKCCEYEVSLQQMQTQAQQQQLIEKNQIIEMLQNQLSQAEQTIDNLKFKQTEQKLLSIIVTDRQQECQNKLELQFQKIMQETTSKEKMKAMEQENLELKLKLQALQEVIKENVRLKRKMQFNTEQPESLTNSPIKYSPISKRLIQKTIQSSCTRKSTEKKSTINSDYYPKNIYCVKQSFQESHHSKKQTILEKIINSSSAKFNQENELIKQCITLLNNMISDLRRKQNQINNEDQTKKKSVKGFIEKMHQQVNFVIKKLQQGKQLDHSQAIEKV